MINLIKTNELHDQYVLFSNEEQLLSQFNGTNDLLQEFNLYYRRLFNERQDKAGDLCRESRRIKETVTVVFLKGSLCRSKNRNFGATDCFF